MESQSLNQEVLITIISESQSTIRELATIETDGSGLRSENARRMPGLIDEIRFAVDFCGPIIGNITCGILANWIWTAITKTKSRNEPVKNLHLTVQYPNKHIELTIDAADQASIEQSIEKAISNDHSKR